MYVRTQQCAASAAKYIKGRGGRDFFFLTGAWVEEKEKREDTKTRHVNMLLKFLSETAGNLEGLLFAVA